MRQITAKIMVTLFLIVSPAVSEAGGFIADVFVKPLDPQLAKELDNLHSAMGNPLERVSLDIAAGLVDTVAIPVIGVPAGTILVHVYRNGSPSVIVNRKGDVGRPMGTNGSFKTYGDDDLFCIDFGPAAATRFAALGSDLAALKYVASHGDLIEAYGADPNRGRVHFCNHGLREERESTFDPFIYGAAYGDLIRRIGDNAFALTRHYIVHGHRENRDTSAFCAKEYLNAHGDLQRAFGDNESDAARHYIKYGYGEGRPVPAC